ncbi:hypothetical protein [Streptomyces sedi]|uniref:Uncharacterized protein n=1 Tax=Streptomyces sedi TaxID=555059 RepID=A0A5C4UTS4_9ACTN|nr:hypothetical protein [Streptomyces sedi]TNM27061.1 hypothetical protein FH715_22160 [Streptomyces sedi]
MLADVLEARFQRGTDRTRPGEYLLHGSSLDILIERVETDAKSPVTGAGQDESRMCGKGHLLKAAAEAHSAGGICSQQEWWMKPVARLWFRLGEIPESGIFHLASPSAEFAESLRTVVAGADLERDHARCVLLLKRETLTTRSGVHVAFAHPELRTG